MASRRFIRKFDHLSDDAQQQLEILTDLYLEMGHRRRTSAQPLEASGRVLAFPHQGWPTRSRFLSALHDPDRPRMLKVPGLDRMRVDRMFFSFRY
jgi:hypothetical protein